MDYSPWILQARTLEWVAFPFSGGSSQPRDQTQGSHIAGGFFTSWATRETQIESTTSQFCIFLVINIRTLTYPLCSPTDAALIPSILLSASRLLWARQNLTTFPPVTTSHFETVWNAHQDYCWFFSYSQYLFRCNYIFYSFPVTVFCCCSLKGYFLAILSQKGPEW